MNLQKKTYQGVFVFNYGIKHNDIETKCQSLDILVYRSERVNNKNDGAIFSDTICHDIIIVIIVPRTLRCS